VFRVRGNPFQTFEVPPFTFNFDTLTLDDGPAAISATATDAANARAIRAQHRGRSFPRR
jgi:hypothetical protein